MIFGLNLSLLSIHITQMSIQISQLMHPSYFSIRNSEISYNYFQSFYNQYNTGLQNGKSCFVSNSKFSNFLQPVFKILNGPDSDINREDVYGTRPSIDLSSVNLTVFESLFQSCKGTDGGVFFIVFAGDVIIEKTNFVNCTADGRGGVIFFYGSDLIISESCFSHCTSESDGYSIFCASGRKTVDIEKCHFFGSEGGGSAAVFISGFDVTLKNLNCSKSNVKSGSEVGSAVFSSFYVSPLHFFSFEMVEINRNSGPSLISFDQVDQVDTIQNVNIIDCNLTGADQSSSFLLILHSCTAVFKKWAFSFTDDELIQNFNENPLVLFSSDDDSSLTILDSFFSLPESSVSKDLPQLTILSSVEFASSKLANVDFVESKGCWNQNRFKFREPKTHQKIIISVVVIAIFVIGFVFMIVLACKDEKDQKEMLKVQEFNEMQNDLIRKEGMKNHFKKKFRKEKKTEDGDIVSEKENDKSQ